MKTSVATVSLPGTLEEKLLACADSGFDGVEIFEPDLMCSAATPEDIAHLAQRLGLTLDLYQPFRDAEGTTEDLFQDTLRRAERTFQLMQRLGVETLLVCSNVTTASIEDERVVVDQLRRLGDLAQAHRCRIAYEALAWGRFVNTYGHAYDLVVAADHPAVGTCLDSFHILSRGHDPSGIADMDPEKIFFVQLADAPKLSMDVLSWSRHHRLFPGQGDFDLPGFMDHLVTAGYRGPVSLEIFNDVFRQGDERRRAVEGLRSLRWLEDSVHRRHGSNSVAAERLPLVEAPEALDFVEIRGRDLHRVEAVLAGMGFALLGRHRSKSVELWRAGEAHIVINRTLGPDSASPARIAALGFRVTAPEESMLRGLELGATAVPRNENRGEEVLRGVYAPDGREIFFSPLAPSGHPSWVNEFGGLSKPVQNSENELEPIVSGIDHVNLAQPWEYADEALLFFESVLDLDQQSSQDVPGPTGLVRSRVVASAQRHIRIPLNVLPLHGPPSNTGEHMAFLCDDIIAAAHHITNAGVEVLPIPENYYTLLEARLDLPQHMMQQIRELNILYDADEDGEFLHFYTETVGNLFFEVVQRIGSYDAYGAPDAPVRMAAQYRRAQQ